MLTWLRSILRLEPVAPEPTRGVYRRPTSANTTAPAASVHRPVTDTLFERPASILPAQSVEVALPTTVSDRYRWLEYDKPQIAVVAPPIPAPAVAAPNPSGQSWPREWLGMTGCCVPNAMITGHSGHSGHSGRFIAAPGNPL